MLLKFAPICTILRLVREVVVLLDYNVTGQTGFSIHWDGSVIVAEFNGFVVSPVGVTNVITSLRNAVEYRGHEKWDQIVKIKDGKKIKSNLRHILLREFDWEFQRNCVAFAVCVPKDDVETVESVIKASKHIEHIKVFDRENEAECQDWVKSQLAASNSESRKASEKEKVIC